MEVEHTAPQGAGLSPPSTTRAIGCCLSHCLHFQVLHPSSSAAPVPAARRVCDLAQEVLRLHRGLAALRRRPAQGVFFPQDAFLLCCASPAVCLLFLLVTQGLCCGTQSGGGRLTGVVQHAQTGCGVVLSLGWAPWGIVAAWRCRVHPAGGNPCTQSNLWG